MGESNKDAMAICCGVTVDNRSVIVGGEDFVFFVIFNTDNDITDVTSYNQEDRYSLSKDKGYSIRA